MVDLSFEKHVITVNHEPIEGYMPAMTMDLHLPVGEPVDVTPGDGIEAHLLEYAARMWLVDVVTVSRGQLAVRDDIAAIRVGELWPQFPGQTELGEPWQLQGPTVLSFLYTRCPNPEFCPALVGRLLTLQEKLPAGARIVTVSLDPENDTPQTLHSYGRNVGADPDLWTLVHAEEAVVEELVLRAGQTIVRAPGGIRHAHRLIVLDAQSKVIERYDHNDWAIERVVRQLETGRPVGLHP